MFFIHGGSWSENSGNGETGFFRPDYFLDRDVVLVTINYRLDALGLNAANIFYKKIYVIKLNE